MFHTWEDSLNELKAKDRNCNIPENKSGTETEIGVHTMVSFIWIFLAALAIYLVLNETGFYENFIKAGPVVDGLVAGSIIGLILEKKNRRIRDQSLEEDRELAKQKEAEALGYMDYRSYRS